MINFRRRAQQQLRLVPLEGVFGGFARRKGKRSARLGSLGRRLIRERGNEQKHHFKHDDWIENMKAENLFDDCRFIAMKREQDGSSEAPFYLLRQCDMRGGDGWIKGSNQAAISNSSEDFGTNTR
ncbi:unnamed protein product [Lactuca virosa]|uniref:Uncharacterized protein n=1 Tax=Lactuca virosa TaxID=75947 RepID=A0AAU9NSX9_9ASTR|nr:unnamed protein product [Lactuca virosa]